MALITLFRIQGLVSALVLIHKIAPIYCLPMNAPLVSYLPNYVTAVVIIVNRHVGGSFHWFGMQPTALAGSFVHADLAYTPCHSPTIPCSHPI